MLKNENFVYFFLQIGYNLCISWPDMNTFDQKTDVQIMNLACILLIWAIICKKSTPFLWNRPNRPFGKPDLNLKNQPNPRWVDRPGNPILDLW